MPASAETIQLDLAGLDKSALPHLDQYFGVWAIEERRFAAAVDQIRNLDVRSHLDRHAGEARAAAADGRSFPMAGDVAVIALHGTLMKQVGSLTNGTSTTLARRQVRQAAADESVGSILLHVDSPGGTVAGTKDLADDVAAAAKRKPVTAFVEDLGASAAYWIATAAGRVVANETALVGSIGVFSVVHDFSAQAAMLGVKVHVLRTAPQKGAGVPGDEISSEQLAEFQRIVDNFGELFVRQVAAGRSMGRAQARELADGRVHLARDAMRLGLIDGVETVDRALADLRRGRQSRARVTTLSASDPGGETVSETQATRTNTAIQPLQFVERPNAQEPASYDDVVAACPGADEKFICDMLRQKATAAAAAKAWQETLAERVRIRDEEIEQLKAEKAKGEQRSTKGQQIAGLGAGQDASDAGRTTAVAEDPLDAFQQAVREKVAAGMKRPRAIRAVAVEDPDLHAAYLEAYTATHRRKRK